MQLLSNWVPPLAWMAVIFWGSSTPGLRATPLVVLALDRLAAVPGLDALAPLLARLMSEPWAELLLRKAAHTVEFAILAYLVARALSAQPRGTKQHPLPLAGALSLAYAVTDELHQHFVPGRSCRFEDVLIDAAGIRLGLVLARMADRKPSTSLRH